MWGRHHGIRVLNWRSAGSHGVPKSTQEPMIRCLQTFCFNSSADGEIKLHTSSTSADTSERTSAAASVLLIRMCVAQLLCHGAISQPDLDVGQISPVRARSQWDVTHTTFNQSAHVLRAQIVTFISAVQKDRMSQNDRDANKPPPCKCGL